MFYFDENYILQNEVAALIPLELAQFNELFNASNNPDIWKYFTEAGYGKENFEKYFATAVLARKNGKEYPLAIKDVSSNQIVGMTRIYNVDNELKNVKIGHTWISKDFQGSRLNKNCKYLLFQFLFDQLDFQRIGFGASAENTISIKALESVGCVQEGKLRRFLPDQSSDKRIDIVLMSIIKTDWDHRVKSECAVSPGLQSTHIN